MRLQAGNFSPTKLWLPCLSAEVAATPMDDPGTPLIYGFIPAITLLLLYALINYLCLKSKVMRVFMCGKPSILIHNGKILYSEIKK